MSFIKAAKILQFIDKEAQFEIQYYFHKVN